jgi:hypothetical protein
MTEKKSKPLGLHKERELAKHLRKQLASIPKMPMAVTEMTPNEYALFESLAKVIGTLQFVSDYIDPVTRESRRLVEHSKIT